MMSMMDCDIWGFLVRGIGELGGFEKFAGLISLRAGVDTLLGRGFFPVANCHPFSRYACLSVHEVWPIPLH